MKLPTKLMLVAAGVGLAAWRIERQARRYSFRDKVVALTGGSRGLGLALARRLVDEGATVVLLARSADSLDRARRDLHERQHEGRVASFVCDVGDAEQVNAAFRHIEDLFGRVDVVINNAGIVLCAPFENHTKGDFDVAIATHLTGPLNTTRAALPMMRRQGGGRILNISSIGGKVGIPHMSAYSASKFGLVGLSRSLAAELRSEGVYLTVVCPGLMRTGSQRAALFSGDRAGEFRWFATMKGTPGLSIAADKAARRILDACRYGRAEVVLPWQWKLVAVGDNLMPGLSVAANDLVNRFLPEPVAGEDEGQAGRIAGAEQTDHWPIRGLEKVAADYNQE